MNDFLLAAVSLWRREMVRFFRQRSRIVGALGSPLLFWLLLGSGVGSSFRLGNTDISMGYLEYFFPGTVVLILLFTSIFSTISIIEDRKEGFLQAVLVVCKIFPGNMLANRLFVAFCFYQLPVTDQQHGVIGSGKFKLHVLAVQRTK